MTYLLGDGRKATSLTSFLFLTLSETAELGEAYRHEHRFEMNRIRFCVITVLLILGAFTAAADVKVRDVCPMLKFQGEVIKNKTTKQKEPSGQGTLSIFNGYKYVQEQSYLPNRKVVKYIVKITGVFDCDRVRNATLFLDNEEVFKGDLTYNYHYDKKTKLLTLNIKLVRGLLTVTYYSRKEYKSPIEDLPSIEYMITVTDGDKYPLKNQIECSRDELKISTPLFSTHASGWLTELLTGKLASNTWIAKPIGGPYNRAIWEMEWLDATLSSGARLIMNDDNRITVSGDSTYYQDFSNGNVKFLVRLADNGFFNYVRDGNRTLIFPNGDRFTGTYKDVPFKFTNKGYGECKDLFGKDQRPSDSPLSVYLNLVTARTSDFKPWEGVYTHKDGKQERVKDGEFPDRRLSETATTGLPDYNDIIANAIEYNADVFDALCKKDFWSFIGKTDLSDLDKELYKQTSEYTRKYKQYQDLLSGIFYSKKPLKGEYYSDYYRNITTTQAIFQIPFSTDDYNPNPKKLPAISMDVERLFPLLSSCEKVRQYQGVGELCSEPVLSLNIPSKDVGFLKYLQTAYDAGELELVLLYRPGVEYDYSQYGHKKIIVNPVGMYLINKVTNKVLYDFSKLCDKSTSKYKEIFRQIRADELREDAEREGRYHQQAIRQKCNWCLGRGYTDGWMGKRIECTQCHGRGYVYTHYYDD